MEVINQFRKHNFAPILYLLLSFTLIIIFLGPLKFGSWFLVDNIRWPIAVILFVLILEKGTHSNPDANAIIARIFQSKYFIHLLFILSTIAFIRIKFLELAAFKISGVDFSHIDYAIWSTTHGDFMQIPIIGKQPTYLNFFGNHFSPILYVWVGAKWIYDSVYSTLIIHALALSASIYPIYAIFHHYCNKTYAAIFSLSYVLTGILASTLQFDIHQEAFFPLFVGIFLYGIAKSNRFWIFCGFLLTLTIKEDAGLYVGAASFVLLWTQNKFRFMYFCLFILGFLAAYLSYAVIMPIHQPATKPEEAYYLPMWDRYGKSAKEILLTMMQKPHWVFGDILGNKAVYKSLLAWGFLPIFSKYGLLALTPLVVLVTANGQPHHLGAYYGSILLPFYAFATANALRGLIDTNISDKIVLGFAVFAFIGSTTIGGAYLKWQQPNPKTEIAQKVNHFIASFSGTIYVQGGILPHLRYRANLRRIDSTNLPPNTQMVVIAEGISTAPLSEPLATLKKKLNQFDIVFQEAGFIIFQCRKKSCFSP